MRLCVKIMFRVRSSVYLRARAWKRREKRDLVAVNDHPDKIRDTAKEEEDKVELRGLAFAPK